MYEWQVYVPFTIPLRGGGGEVKSFPAATANLEAFFEFL
jgi:hypothetical protein